MPTKKAKTAKSTKSKKTATKKKAAIKTTPAPKSVHPLNKKYLHKEQEDFFASNPSAKPLIIIFLLLAIAAFIYIIQVQGLLLGLTM